MSGMNQLLNAIAVLATFIASVGLIYFTLDYTVGRIKIVNGFIIGNKIPVKIVLFIGIGIFIVLRFCTFYLPFNK